MPDDVPAASPPPPAAPVRKRKSATKKSPATRTDAPTMPPWNVVLLNDEEHTYDYVIRMLGEIFGHAQTKAYQMARTVDKEGRVIVLTTHKELAELKREQIESYGTDVMVATCKGSMSAVIEPAA